MLGIHRLGDVRGQILDLDPDPAALYLAGADQFLHDAAGHADRHGEADPDIAAAGGEDRGVDPDHLAVEVDQWPARVAGIDRGVGLDEILVAFDAEPAAAEGADDPRGDGLAEPERIADRQDEIADLQAIGIAHRHRGQVLRRDLQHGDIRLGIPPDQFCREAPVIFGRDLDGRRVLDDMRVAEHIAASRIYDDAGAGRLRLALFELALLRQVEETAEEWILQQRVFFPHLALHRDVDDARRDPGQHRREARYGRAVYLWDHAC